MDDTDRVLRPTTPFVRPTAAEVFDDPTPTTAPSWAPPPRLARGTVIPSSSSSSRRARPAVPPVPKLRPLVFQETSPDLVVRLIPSPRWWGPVVRVDLDVPVSAATADATAPVVRIGARDWRPVAAAGAVGVGVVLAAAFAFGASRSGSAASSASSSVAAPVQVASAVTARPVVTPIAVEPLDPEAVLPDVPAAAPAERAMPIAAPAPAPSHGVLMIGAKPPCRILIDGKDTGLTTPQRQVRVPAGRHTITLVNAEFGIEHTSTVTVTGGRKAKLIRDLSAAID